MWYIGEESTISSVHEESHAGDQADEGRLMTGVEYANDDLEDTCADTQEGDPVFLRPDGTAGFVVDVIRNQTTD